MSAQFLAELAAARGLTRTAAILNAPDAARLIERVADADLSLGAEPQPDAALLLGLMVRRGLDQQLVIKWIQLLESSLERGLAAWDVLSGSLIDDRDYLSALRSFLDPVRELLPATGQRGVELRGRTPSSLLRSQLGEGLPPPVPASPSPETVSPGLSSIWALFVAGGDAKRSLTESEALSGLRAQGRLLGLAHFPTLSSLWLEFTSRELGDDESYSELAEVLLDAHAVDRLPGGTARLTETRLAKYAMARAAIDRGDPGAAYALLKAIDVLTLAPVLRKNEDAGVQLVRAELGLRTGDRPVPPARVEEIVQSNPTWRYAARVRACMAAAMCALDSASPLRMLDAYLTSFGNDDAIWLGLTEFGPAGAAWYAPMMGRLAREALALPHEPSVWVAIATFVGDEPAPAVAEIRQRLVEQCSN